MAKFKSEASFLVACISKRIFGGQFRGFWCAFQTHATEKSASDKVEALQSDIRMLYVRELE